MVQDRFQRGLHLRRTGIPVFRDEFAGFQNGPARGLTAAAGRRELFTAHTPGDRAFAGRNGKIFFAGKREAIVIQQTVKRDAQGIQIRPLVIRLSGEHFRRHVIRGSLGGKTMGQGLQAAGDTEISQLIENITGRFVIDENVRGFDIPVKDVSRCAEFKGTADINADTEDFLLGQCPLAHQGFQRRQQFHADEDIIADGVGSSDDFVILDADNMLGAFQLLHHLDFGNILAGNIVVITLALIGRKTFRTQGVGFSFTDRNRDDLDGSINAGMIPANGTVNR